MIIMSDQERTRRHEEEDSEGTPQMEEMGTETLVRNRREVEELLRAGDDIINRVISGDSTAFLAAGQQQGGQ